MTITASIQRVDIFTAVRAFILGAISCEVVQGLDNGVPMPKTPFIAITPLFATRLSTNVDTESAQVKSIEKHEQYTLQIDCYGPDSSDWANVITALWRDDYAVQAMAPKVTPLHADDPKMMPIIDGEANFEERWMITAHVQYNPILQVTQQSATALNLNLVNVDRAYPPQ